MDPHILLPRYVGHYVMITQDPSTLSERFNRDGAFCYIGKVAVVDANFVLLSPFSIHRPDLPNNITTDVIINDLQEYEARHAPNVIRIAEHVQPKDWAEEISYEIGRQVDKILDDATKEKSIPLNCISGIELLL